jgi:CHAT domain-containing protein/Tfp pilus assembly protein PilF
LLTRIYTDDYGLWFDACFNTTSHRKYYKLSLIFFIFITEHPNLTMMKTLFYTLSLIFLFGLFFQSSFAQQSDSVVYSLKDTVLAREYLEEARTLSRTKQYDAAHEKAEEARRIYSNLLGSDSKELANAWHRIGAIYYLQRDFEQAIEAFDSVLQIRIRVFGEKHADVAKAYYNLGLANYDKRDYDTALKKYDKALDIRKKVLGNNDLSVAATYKSMGNSYGMRGEIEQSIDLFEKALKINRKHLEEDDREILALIENIGVSLERNRQYDEAIAKYEEVLNINKAKYGERHLNVARSLNKIGVAYFRKGDQLNARPYFEKSLKIREALLDQDSPELAVSINNMGVIYKNMGLFDEAKAAFEKTLDMRRKIYEEGHPQIAQSIDNLADLYNRIGEYEKAIDYFKTAIEMRKGVYGKDHRLVAESMNGLGISYENNSEFQKAIKIHQENLAIRLKILDPNHPDIGQTYTNLASSYVQLGEFNKGIEFQKQALSNRIHNYGPEDHRVARIHSYLGMNFIQISQYHKAETHLNEANEIYQKTFGISNEDYNGYYITLSYMGLALIKKGAFQKGIDIIEQALEIQLKYYGGENHPDIASCYSNIGLGYDNLGYHEKATQYFQKALQIQLKILGEENLDVANSYQNLAASVNRLGQSDQSKTYLESSFHLLIKLLGENHPTVGQSYFNQGKLKYDAKEFYQAINFTNKALNIYLKSLGEQHENTAMAYHNLGEIHSSKGEYEQALQYFQKAENINKEIFKGKNKQSALTFWATGKVLSKQKKFPQAISYSKKALEALNFKNQNKLEEVSSLIELWNTLEFSSNVYQNWYSFDNNLDHLYQAQHIHRLNEALINYQFKNSGDFDRQNIAAKVKYLAANIMQTNTTLHSKTDSTHYLAQQFNWSERSKAYLLYQSMQDANALQFAGIPDSLLEKEYNLRVDINYFEKQKQSQINAGLSETDSIVLDYNSRLFDLRQEYTALKSQLESSYPDYYRLKYDLAVVDVPAVQSELLTDSTTLLEYFVGDSSVYIFTLNQTDYQVIEVDKDSTFNDLINQMRKGLYASFTSKDSTDLPYRENPTFAAEQYAAAAYNLYQILVAPVEDQLKAKVIIIPDGVLGYIPFQALLKEKPSAAYRYHTHHYFGNDHRISYSYSATLLKEMRDKQHKDPAPKSLLAVAPYYDGTEYLLDSLYNEEMKALGIDISLATREGFETLENSGPEAKAISELWQGDMLINDQATEQNFTDMAGQYRQLHLATHGKANDRVGEYAFLAFSEIPDSIENELLYVKDIYNLSLNADLVVLSACETGIGELQRGEGIVSLARAFAYAGAKSIFTTLWSVNDAKTKDLMLHFHRQLKAGDEKDVALWKAQQQYLQKHKGQAAHPYYWAGFVGVGDMRNID